MKSEREMENEFEDIATEAVAEAVDILSRDGGRIEILVFRSLLVSVARRGAIVGMKAVTDDIKRISTKRPHSHDTPLTLVTVNGNGAL